MRRSTSGSVEEPAAAPSATQTAARSIGRASLCKLLVLALLVAQNSSLVLTASYSRQRDGPLYKTTVLVFLGEVVKALVSLAFTALESGDRTGAVLHTFFVAEAHSLWRMAVPALLYTMSNNLALVGMSNLPAVMYMVTNQMKIPATALMSALLLQRRYQPVQWGAIATLVVGVVLVQLRPDAPSAAATSRAHEQKPLLGLLAVLTNCAAGAFAGVWFEKMIKSARPDGHAPPLWVSNLQLCLFALPLSGAAMLLEDWPAMRDGEMLRGFDGVAVAVLALHVAGGIVVALTVKHADNVAKTFATSIAIVVGCVGSYVLFDSTLSPPFFAGLVLVLAATIIYSNPSLCARSTLGLGVQLDVRGDSARDSFAKENDPLLLSSRSSQGGAMSPPQSPQANDRESPPTARAASSSGGVVEGGGRDAGGTCLVSQRR